MVHNATVWRMLASLVTRVLYPPAPRDIGGSFKRLLLVCSMFHWFIVNDFMKSGQCICSIVHVTDAQYIQANVNTSLIEQCMDSDVLTQNSIALGFSDNRHLQD